MEPLSALVAERVQSACFAPDVQNVSRIIACHLMSFQVLNNKIHLSSSLLLSHNLSVRVKTRGSNGFRRRVLSESATTVCVGVMGVCVCGCVDGSAKRACVDVEGKQQVVLRSPGAALLILT